MTEQRTPIVDARALRRRISRVAFITSGAGIGFELLALVSWWLLRRDREALASAEDAQSYLVESGIGGATIAGLYLLPLSVVLFLWFIVALRGWIRGTQLRRNVLVSDLQLVSSVAFTTVYLIGSSAVATSLVVAAPESGALPVGSLRALSAFGDTLMTVMGVRMAAVFVFATSSLGLTTGVLPSWFTLLDYGLGVLLFLAPMVDITLRLVFPVWVIALASMLMWHVLRLSEDDLPGFAERYSDAASPTRRPSYEG